MENPNKAYIYVSDALDRLFLLRLRCKLSVKSEGLLDKAEIALTELLDSVNPDLG
jgi:hypothetical protein